MQRRRRPSETTCNDKQKNTPYSFQSFLFYIFFFFIDFFLLHSRPSKMSATFRVTPHCSPPPLHSLTIHPGGQTLEGRARCLACHRDSLTLAVLVPKCQKFFIILIIQSSFNATNNRQATTPLRASPFYLYLFFFFFYIALVYLPVKYIRKEIIRSMLRYICPLPSLFV